MRNLLAAVSLVALAACGLNGTDRNAEEASPTASPESGTDYGYETYSDDNLADSMASDDGEYLSPANRSAEPVSGDATAMGGDATRETIPDPENRPVMQAQVVLDRQGFGPGVIDGKMGMSTQNALRGFQEANELDVTGKLDDATKEALGQWERLPATRVVTIPASWGEVEYEDIPDDPAEQAKLERLGYTSLDEKIAERFHTTIDVLKTLNPNGRPAGMKQDARSTTTANPGNAGNAGAPRTAPSQSKSTKSTATATAGDPDTASAASPDSFFSAGQQIRVPNIGADRIEPGAIAERGWQQTLASLGVGTEQPQVERVVVSKSGGTLKAFDAEDRLVAMFTVTSGSTRDPLPLGNWEVLGVGRNPTFSYNPELFWDVPDDEAKQQLPPGPNGPVGVVWIDLSKEHYGIHGTPEPQNIGRTRSHGCVRLTNWDAARLSQMVDTKTKVVFEA